ncbi:MAG TPA: NAD-dependent epimerase/dehydratase family protein, partial [Microlunatus sp.]
MKWLLAGASGFLGTALRVRLAGLGHEVVRLVRREPATAAEYRWDPDSFEIDRAALEGVDAVVNLCGVGVADWLWTPSRRQVLHSSRVNPTGTLAAALADRAPAGDAPVLIQASGIAVYGTQHSAVPHTEESPAASDFLAGLVVDWEQATDPAIEAGVRVVIMRTSPVLDRSGGAFRLMKVCWSLGGGAVLGDGQQRMPMISLDDYLRFVLWAAATPAATGP